MTKRRQRLSVTRGQPRPILMERRRVGRMVRELAAELRRRDAEHALAAARAKLSGVAR